MPTLADLSPNIAIEFAALIDGVWDGRMDPGLLERCRVRMCELIGAPPDAGRHASTPTPAIDGPLVDDVLAFAELWIIDPHAITDDMAAAVRRHLNDREVAAFTIGLATIEAQARLAIALGATS
ncbi:MAG: hypothetical protein ACI9C1_002938 [Candidatus Aldehydirespiratoraceae bacterium]|jgi:hypothetical protein